VGNDETIARGIRWNVKIASHWIFSITICERQNFSLVHGSKHPLPMSYSLSDYGLLVAMADQLVPSAF
jgi:hypothetical protein